MNRKHAFIQLALAALLLFSGKAFAWSDMHATQNEAYGHCTQQVSATISAWVASLSPLTNPTRYRVVDNPSCKRNGSDRYYYEDGYAKDPNGVVSSARYRSSNFRDHGWTTDCAPGSSPVLENGVYVCRNPDARCLALNNDISTQGPVPRTWTSKCLTSGCNAVLDSPTETTIAGSSTKIYRGTLRYTGACGAPPTLPSDLDGSNDDKSPDRQECVPIAGQTVCVKPDGQHCYSTRPTRQNCWRPGEVGQKADGNLLQVRNPGNTEQPPTPPDGDTYTKSGDSITTITNNSTTITTTTTTNYTNVNGTEPPGVDQSGEGSDGQSQGNGDDLGGKLDAIKGDTGTIKDFLTGGDSSAYPDTSGNGTGIVQETTHGDTGFDTSGYGWTRSCPGPTTVEILGNSITFDPSSVMCDWISVGGWFVLLIVGWRCLAMLASA